MKDELLVIVPPRGEKVGVGSLPAVFGSDEITGTVVSFLQSFVPLGYITRFKSIFFRVLAVMLRDGNARTKDDFLITVERTKGEEALHKIGITVGDKIRWFEINEAEANT